MGVDTNLFGHYVISHGNFAEFFQQINDTCLEAKTILERVNHPQDGYLYGQPYYDYSIGELSVEDTKRLYELVKDNPKIYTSYIDGLRAVVEKCEGLYWSS